MNYNCLINKNGDYGNPDQQPSFVYTTSHISVKFQWNFIETYSTYYTIISYLNIILKLILHKQPENKNDLVKLRRESDI